MLAGVSRRGIWLAGAELAGSRTIRPRSLSLGAPVPTHRSCAQRVPDSLLATISQATSPSPLNPDVWNQVLAVAEVPGRETIVAALRDGVPLSLEDVVYDGVRVPNHPMLYLDLPRVKEAVKEEVTHGRYVALPPSTDLSWLNLSAMGVAPRFKSFAARRAFEGFSNRVRSLLKRAALDDFEGRPAADGPGLNALGDLAAGVKWRVIHDLTHPEESNVNAHTESPYFKLPTAVEFAKQLSRGAYIWKGDVDKAFRNVPVRKRDWPLLAFYIDGVLYVDTRLPFGHVLSPYYFVNFVGRPILYVAVRRGASLLGVLKSYIDDFFGGCDTYEDALAQMQLWLKVCADLGVPVSKAKTFLPAQVVEILGFIIDTVHMSISVDPLRIQEILDELSHVEGRKTVKRKELERLAGKMVFVCSVVPGGRTFMREILDTLNRLRSSSHWAHLTAGFREDLLWWKRFAQNWNGVEPIPPPVTIPWRWLTSDASGDHGIGVFCCGAALHIPLPLSQFKAEDKAELDLIIAETELIAAVTLVALAAPLFRGEHLLLGVDNTVAISWMDSGTAKRPRAMRALRVLWRLQALYRVHVSTRYIRSEHNTLADAASRRDAFRFFRASREWESSHYSSVREYGLETHGRSSLVASPYGSAGGAAGLLVEYLVEGHDPSVPDSEGQVERVLDTISAFAGRFVAQEHRRLHHVPRDDRQKGRSAPRLLLDQDLCGLLGESQVLYCSRGTESSAASGGAAVSARSGAEAGEASGQGGAVHASASAQGVRVRTAESDQRGSADHGAARVGGLLGVPETRSSDSKEAREAGTGANARRPRGTRHVPPFNGPSLQDHPIRRALAPHRSASAIRSALVPLESIQPMDLALATPVLPDHIVRAVHDRSYTAVAFAVPGTVQPHRPTVAAAHGSFLSARLRSPGVHEGDSDLASHAPRRLEVAGSGHVVCRGRSDSESAWRAVEPHCVTAGDDPPT